MLNLERWVLGPGGTLDPRAELGRHSKWGVPWWAPMVPLCPSAHRAPMQPSPAPPALCVFLLAVPLARLWFPSPGKCTSSFPGLPFGCLVPLPSVPSRHSLSTSSSPPTSKWLSHCASSTSMMSPSCSSLYHLGWVTSPLMAHSASELSERHMQLVTFPELGPD